MNPFLQQSIEYARSRAYLDDLYTIYITIPNAIRDIDETKWERVERAFDVKDDEALVRELLGFDLFPIKDSYVPFLRKDYSAISRNPLTVTRLACELRDMGIEKIYEKCSTPKEANRQIGPMFKFWIKKGKLGFPVLPIDDFAQTESSAILDASDKAMQDFAHDKIGYHHEKGLDFLARIKGQYVIGEAKFLTDFGGHQNAQLNDALATLKCEANAVKIAILDGVLYLDKKDKMVKTMLEHQDENIMSALVLRNFLFSL